MADLWEPLLLLALILAVGMAIEWPRRRREEPIRREIRARPVVTFRTPVMVPDNRGPVYLTVRGDVFEVSAPLKVVRLVFGPEHCYRAEDTTVKVCPRRRNDLIEIGGRPGRGISPLKIGSRKMNRQIWDALVHAGVQPIGPPPQR
jgi:hypothetical protein